MSFHRGGVVGELAVLEVVVETDSCERGRSASAAQTRSREPTEDGDAESANVDRREDVVEDEGAKEDDGDFLEDAGDRTAWRQAVSETLGFELDSEGPTE